MCVEEGGGGTRRESFCELFVFCFSFFSISTHHQVRGRSIERSRISEGMLEFCVEAITFCFAFEFHHTSVGSNHEHHQSGAGDQIY